MLLKIIKSEKRQWVCFAASLIILGAIITSVSVWLCKSYASNVKERTINERIAENKIDAINIDEFLLHGKVALSATVRAIDRLLQNNSQHAQIESLLVAESEYYLKQENLGFCHFVGFIKDEYFSGGHWTPTVGYVPNRRPWYSKALNAQGDIAFIEPHVNPGGREPVISLSTRFTDKKSVLAIDLYLKNITSKISRVKKTDIWLILDKNGLVIAHSNPSQRGLNYLLSKFWGKEEQILAQKIISSNEKLFSVNLKNKNYIAFSSIIQDKWYMVRLVDKDSLWHNVNLFVIKCIIISILIFLFASLIITFYFVYHLRKTRESNFKTNFIFNLCNEISTFVTGILGINSVIIDETTRPDIITNLTNIQNESKNTLALVNNILDIIKIEPSKNNEIFMGYDLFCVLSNCLDECIAKASAKNLQLYIDCNRDIPVNLWGNENYIKQIICNLVFNIIKFTDKGKILISIEAKYLQLVENSNDSIMLILSIRNSKILSKETKSHKLKKLLKEQSVWQNYSELELFLTKKLVQKCGGQISNEIDSNGHLTFIVKIPQLILNAEPIGDFETKYKNLHKAETSDETFFAPYAHILIVDDIEINLKVFYGFLKKTKIKIDVAQSGTQCLKLIKENNYDLIFLDKEMPVMNGIETCCKIKATKNSKNTPIIAFSQEQSDTHKESLLSAGFIDYIQKPVRQKDLLRMLKWYLPEHLILNANDLNNSINNNINFAQAQKPTPKNSLTEKMKFLSKYINVEVGLKYCIEDETLYTEMLQEYTDAPIIKDIEYSFEKGDWKNYQSYIKILRDSSEVIGATKITEIIDNLQKAYTDNNIEFIRKNHTILLSMHTELLENLKSGLKK